MVGTFWLATLRSPRDGRDDGGSVQGWPQAGVASMTSLFWTAHNVQKIDGMHNWPSVAVMAPLFHMCLKGKGTIEVYQAPQGKGESEHMGGMRR